jgi:uncharacterized membrane protein YidH (DUF202 family)
MDRLARLHLVARITYYLGWIAAILAGGLHIDKFGTALERAVNLSDRNLLEASFLLFVMCMASEVRTLVFASSNEMPAAKRQAA